MKYAIDFKCSYSDYTTHNSLQTNTAKTLALSILMGLFLSSTMATKVEASQLTVSLVNSLSEQPLSDVLITAYEQRDNPRSTVVVESAITDAQGQVIFDLSGLGEGTVYILGANPYIPGRNAQVFSTEITESGHFHFHVGTSPITLLDGDQKQPLVGMPIRVKKVADRRFRTLTTRTDEQGTSHFDLPGLDNGAVYVAEVRQPFGSSGQTSYSIEMTQTGPIDFVLYRDGRSFVINQTQLLNRITFGATPELLKYTKSVGALVFLGEQLQPEMFDNTELESQINGLNLREYQDLSLWKLLHAIHSKRQLQEVMTQFWDNHFSTDINKTGIDAEKAENQLFRQHALGKFRDLLQISATSPAMLRYLDNASSHKRAPNENYARELMELHTLGVNGGYTEKDVAEVARALTGWRVVGNEFYFDETWHDSEEKIVLGYVISAGGGVEEGERILDILATHPSTADFICTKLLQLFVADQPSAKSKDNCVAVFLNTDGDIRQVVEFVLLSPEFNASPQHRKIKTPFEFVTNVVRNLEVTTPDTDKNLSRALVNMGMPLFKNPVPTGWPETGDKWMTSDQIMQRIKFVNQTLLQTDNNQVHVDLKNLVLNQGYETAEDIVKFLFELTLSNDYSTTEWEIALGILTDTPFDINAGDAEQKLRRLVMTVLSYPSYQLQ